MILEFGNENLFPFSPAARRKEPIEEACPIQSVETGDFIMIETKDSDDDVWPRDLIDEQNENFRDFELNSKVDSENELITKLARQIYYRLDKSTSHVE